MIQDIILCNRLMHEIHILDACQQEERAYYAATHDSKGQFPLLDEIDKDISKHDDDKNKQIVGRTNESIYCVDKQMLITNTYKCKNKYCRKQLVVLEVTTHLGIVPYEKERLEEINQPQRTITFKYKRVVE